MWYVRYFSSLWDGSSETKRNYVSGHQEWLHGSRKVNSLIYSLNSHIIDL